MTLTAETVEKIARLSRLEVKPEDRARVAQELSGILHWIEMLQSVPTDGIEPLASVARKTLPLRDDVVTDGDCVDAVLANAPVAEHDCFAVPKVIE